MYDAGSQSAEIALGGVRMDSIPEGRRQQVLGRLAHVLARSGALQDDNITDELRPFISAGTKLDYTYDTNAVFGGPIQQDKLWFLAAFRLSQTNNRIPLPTSYFPQGGSRRVARAEPSPHGTVRLT